VERRHDGDASETSGRTGGIDSERDVSWAALGLDAAGALPAAGELAKAGALGEKTAAAATHLTNAATTLRTAASRLTTDLTSATWIARMADGDLVTSLGERIRLLRIKFADDTGAISLGGRYTDEQDALIQLAKEVKRRGGVTLEDANTISDWTAQLEIPGHGPAIHPGRPGFPGNTLHINVGPVKHIPVLP
jgi:hypothetical protein